MSVLYFICHHCQRTFPDNIQFEQCQCGRHWCSMKCAERDKYCDTKHDYLGEGFRDGWTCGYCREELATDSDLLRFLLERYNLTRDQAEQLYRERTVV